jgi:hypothetical protein
MKKLLKILNGCLNHAKVGSENTTNTTNGCHISLNDGENLTIYIPFSAIHPSLDAVENNCTVTMRLPVGGTKFTGISLEGECDLKKSTRIGTIPPPYKPK